MMGLGVAVIAAVLATGLETRASRTNLTVETAAVVYKESPALRALDISGERPLDPIIRLEGINFQDGVIEADVAGTPAPGASKDVRGFIGIAFRVQADPARYEAFYIRPTNGRAEEQLRRNHANQYVGMPEYPWERLRKEHPGVYESYADMVAGEWTKLRIEVEGSKARLFVNGADQPALIVNDLKLGQNASGGVALWVGPGTEGYFTNVKVTPRAR